MTLSCCLPCQHWTQALEARFWMPEALRQCKLLRIAWALLAVLLLCGLQLGWLDRLWLDAGASGSGSQPEPRLSAYSVRRGLASGVSEQPAGSGNTAERGSQCSGPFHVEKVCQGIRMVHHQLHSVLVAIGIWSMSTDILASPTGRIHVPGQRADPPRAHLGSMAE